MQPTFLDGNNRFHIRSYQQQRPFTSMLPGIAGELGIPMWLFYVNRGQGVTSFGVGNKDQPLMEFQPANKAYQLTPLLGFRTFIKVLSHSGVPVYEPFALHPQVGQAASLQEMVIDLNELQLRESHDALGLQVRVSYFILPEEDFAGLVRQVQITNTSSVPMHFEILDGMPWMIPYGVDNRGLKSINRTIEAWMQVVNQEVGIPMYNLRATPGDSVEVGPVQPVHFALSTAFTPDGSLPLPAVVNPDLVFGQDTSLQSPAAFREKSLHEILALPQYADGRTPAAMFAAEAALNPFQFVSIHSLFGHAPSPEQVLQAAGRLRSEAYFHSKQAAARAIAEDLVQPVETKTASREFDAYSRQTFLDNLLRGGWPLHLGSEEKPVTLHIYSRRHGDPERDYNDFYLAPEFYSQGSGNFRDINQNRRSDVLFDPAVKDTNILAFLSLIQADGYNPLMVRGLRFRVPPSKRVALGRLAKHLDRVLAMLEQSFTPGSLLMGLQEEDVELQVSSEEFLFQALQAAEQDFEADFGEGYWIDHWTYLLDLVEGYLTVYPERVSSLLFEKITTTFYDSAQFVQPRSEKFVLLKGRPFQQGSVILDPEKEELIAYREECPNRLRTEGGHGQVYRTCVYTKLVMLAVIKFATMDPMGMGIEMEADKPGWCDALNGLPGLFGSSMAETYELLRLFTFLEAHAPQEPEQGIMLPVEMIALIRKLQAALDGFEVHPRQASEGSSTKGVVTAEGEREFSYWDAAASAREAYRGSVRFGVDGSEENISSGELAGVLSRFADKIRLGITRSEEMYGELVPTFFTHAVEDFEILQGSGSYASEEDKPRIRALRFRQEPLPLFLEGFVRKFKTLTDQGEARKLYRQIRDTALYDRKLGMYVTNESLGDQPDSIGRIRAFTPGWLENQSVFLHMEYKYLLELLRAGLYAEFYEDFRNALIAFQDPARYGRSPLENASFLVSSAHPDPGLHGAGFIARLTGATAEFLSIWVLMMAGQEPFYAAEDGLALRLAPKLPGWLFDEQGKLEFTFLGHCTVSCSNPLRLNTFDPGVEVLSVRVLHGDQWLAFKDGLIPPPYAQLVREGKITRIELVMGQGSPDAA